MGHREKVLIDGVEAPSVTTVLAIVRKPFLEAWRGKWGNKECDRIMRESQELGHRIHAAIEGYFRGDLTPEMSAQEAGMFLLFKQWATDTRFQPLELEMNVQSKLHHYHGSFDAVGHFGDGKLMVLDWKTSSATDALYGAQLAAYAQGYKEMTGTEITEGLVVRMDKKPETKKAFEVTRFDDLPKYFEIFLHAKELYEFVNKKGKWTKEI